MPCTARQWTISTTRDDVWAAQVEQARKNGIRKELIDTIREDRDPTALSPDEREIMTYVQDLLRTKRIPAPVFQALERKYSSQWLVELTGIVNFFAFVSGICNAFEVPPPAGGDALTRKSTNDTPG